MSAPLPFVGQKRMFAREYIKVLEQFKDSTVFVDLFGGSGLLSQITKRMRPDAKVVYNDFDNYLKRLENIPRTNLLLAYFRRIAEGVPRHKPITGEARERIYMRIEQEEKEWGVCGLYHHIVLAHVFNEVQDEPGRNAQGSPLQQHTQV